MKPDKQRLKSVAPLPCNMDEEFFGRVCKILIFVERLRRVLNRQSIVEEPTERARTL